MSGLFRHGNAAIPHKLNGLRIQKAVYGAVIPIVYGRTRIPPTLVGYEDFTATKQKSQGGKGGMFGGGGKGGPTYVYSASVILALCVGKIQGVHSIYDTTGLIQLNTAVETFTVPGGGGTYTTAHASTFYGDYGVARGDAYSFPANDYGSPGSVTLAGTNQTPMVNVGSAPGTGQYVVNTGTGQYTFAAGDVGKVMTITYSYSTTYAANPGQTPPITLHNFTVFTGAQGQAAWSYMTANHPTRALGYSGIAYVASPKLNLGSSGALPNMSFEVFGLLPYGGTTGGDANPKDVLVDVLTNQLYGVAYPSGEIGNLTQYSNFCIANGLLVSLAFDSDRPAADWIKELLAATNSEAFMSQGLLQVAPYGDTTAVGNGATYSPATTPIYDLTDDDFIYEPGQDPVQVMRPTITDRFNNVKVEYLNRANAYNPEIIEEFDQSSIETYRKRQTSPTQMHFFTNQGTAQTAANMQLKRLVYIVNKFKFKIDRRYILLDPMDLVTLTDAALGYNKKPVRLLQLIEDSKGHLDILAEDFPWGTAAPTAYPKQGATPFIPASDADPGSVNTPVMFEAQSRLNDQIGHAIYIGLSGASVNWGGARVWVSTDGTTFRQVGTFFAKSRMGTLTTSLPQTADPDTTDSFNVDLGISAGQLFSGSQADCDNFRTLCYITRDTVQLVNDAFPGAALSGNWTVEQGSFTVGAGSVGTLTGGADAHALAVRNESYPADQFAQATCVVAPTGLNTTGVCVRGSAVAETFYGFYTTNASAFLFKCIAGTITNFATASIAMQVGDIIRLEVVGTSLTAKLNGVVLLTAVDSSIASGAPGIQGLTGVGATKITNFTAGNDSPGELVSYQNATLVSGNVYTLGTRLRRGVAGSIVSVHAIGAQFLRIDDNVVEYDFDPTMIGTTLQFKFTSFNLVGHMEQTLANVTAYSLLITGQSLGLLTPSHATYRPVGNPLTATDVSQVQSDSFVRANENPLNATNWTTPTGGQALKIVGNLVQPTGANSTWSQEFFTNATWPNDQYSEIVVQTASATNSGVAALVRGATGALTYYHADVLGPLGASAAVRLFRRVAGTFTQIGSNVVMTVNSGDKLRLEVVGTTLTVKINGNVIISQTDANIASGSPGLALQPIAVASDAQAGAWAGGSTGTATINVASFPMRVPGQPDIPLSLGAVPGLQLGTLYNVFYDDPAWLGGAVIYQIMTLKEMALFAAGRFFVGSIVTPKAGAIDTIGNNDGGSGAQSGGVAALTMGSASTNVSAPNTVSNANNSFDGDETTFSKQNITFGAGSFANMTLQGLPGYTNKRYISAVLKILWSLPTNSLNGGAVSLGGISWAYNNFTQATIVTLPNAGTTQTKLLTSFALPRGLSLPLVSVIFGFAAPGGSTSGAAELDVFEAWIEVTE